MTESDVVVPPLIPENGFAPEDFPQVTVLQIPYATNTLIRPDPLATVNQDSSLFIDLGNVRIAFPDRVQWGKLVYLVEALWNSHELQQNEEKNDDGDSTDGQGQPGNDVPDLDQQRPRDEVSSPPEAATFRSVPEPSDSADGVRN